MRSIIRERQTLPTYTTQQHLSPFNPGISTEIREDGVVSINNAVVGLGPRPQSRNINNISVVFNIRPNPNPMPMARHGPPLIRLLLLLLLPLVVVYRTIRMPIAAPSVAVIELHTPTDPDRKMDRRVGRRVASP